MRVLHGKAEVVWMIKKTWKGFVALKAQLFSYDMKEIYNMDLFYKRQPKKNPKDYIVARTKIGQGPIYSWHLCQCQW